MLEPPTLIAGLHDVAVMRQPVQQGRGHLGIPKHIAPFREVQVGRDHHAGALVQLGEQVKQQCPARLGKWQIAHLVQDHHVHVHQPVGHLARLVLRLLQLQGVDQFDSGEEPNPNVVMVLPEADFKFTQGQPSAFSRSDLERPVTRYFCQHCGTALRTRSPARPGSFIIKVGTLDDPSVFKPRLAIFTVDKQPFHHIPEDLPAFERRPG